MEHQKTYILKIARRNIGKEAGDYYNGEYGNSPEKIQELLDRGIIEEELTAEEYEKREAKEARIQKVRNGLWILWGEGNKIISQHSTRQGAERALEAYVN